MTDSRAIDQESRRLIREELLTNILVEAGAGSGKTQMLAERMAAGVAAGVYNVEHMAAVTFTRKAASELRGRFHLALEGELSKSGILSLPEGVQQQRTARVQSALSNLERFFGGTIHSFCARLLRERPVESGVSPGFTELDEVQDFELRQRVWRDFVTSARTAGDPDMMALLEADIRPKDLDSAFATICVNDDVDFPPGDAVCPDAKTGSKGAREVLDGTAETPALRDRFRHDLQDSASGTTVSGTVSRLKTPSRPPFCRRVAARKPGTANQRSHRSGGRIPRPRRSAYVT